MCARYILTLSLITSSVCHAMNPSYFGPHCSWDETTSTDDVYKLVFIPQPLFIQLCVQVSHANSLAAPKQPFQELLYKIKAGIIDKNATRVAITEKDAYYRLLSYILFVSESETLINGNKTKLRIGFGQENGFKKHNRCTCSSSGIQNSWWQENKSYMESYRRHEWWTKYNFEANQHTAVVAQFEDLISKLDDPVQHC